MFVKLQLQQLPPVNVTLFIVMVIILNLLEHDGIGTRLVR